MSRQAMTRDAVGDYWDRVYSSKGEQAVSWYQRHALSSLELIRRAALGEDAAIIDVGGGAATLVDDLLAEGYTDLTVLDVSAVALAKARRRLGRLATRVKWIEADITRCELGEKAYDLWHDRAVFHFLTEARERAAYVASLRRAVKQGGYVIIAGFGERGPTRCSGLPVMRYDATALHQQLGRSFQLIEQLSEQHHTPDGKEQHFVYLLCRLVNQAQADIGSSA
jgi:SAM-dependent methyltransferase